MASSACGNGPSGPSFEASLTTRSRPSSRWTSSTGFPGSYGTRSAIDRRKKLSSTSARPGTRETLAAVGVVSVVAAAPPHEPERARHGTDRGGDERLVGPLRLRVDARDGRLGLALRDALAELPHRPAEHGVAPVHDSHRPCLPGFGPDLTARLLRRLAVTMRARRMSRVHRMGRMSRLDRAERPYGMGGMGGSERMRRMRRVRPRAPAGLRRRLPRPPGRSGPLRPLPCPPRNDM